METQVYKREGDNVIGAQVIVSADEGQTIDSIQVTNKTQFDALVAKLDGLTSDYVKYEDGSTLRGRPIDNILTNTNEDANINATLLNGHNSSYFAKASHTHNKNNITNLYEYDISLSKYNVELNTQITVSVKVTNMSGNPVANQSVNIYRDGLSWVSGITNSNGVYSATFKATSAGLVTFGVNNQKVQLLVNEPEPEPVVETWETLYSDTHYIFEHKGDRCRLRITWESARIGATWTSPKTFNFPNYLPVMPVNGYQTNNGVVYYLNTNGKLFLKHLNTAGDYTLEIMLEWTI